MATSVQGYATGTGVNALTAEQHTFFQDEMMERLLPELNWTEYAEKKNIPKRKGAQTNFRRLEALAAIKTELPEGSTPDGVNLNITSINATVKWYGAWTKISDPIDLAGYDPLMQETSGLMGENAGLSIDLITRDVVSAGTNAMYGGGKLTRVTVAAGDVITALDVLKARRALRRAKVKPIRLPEGGGTGYVALIPVDVATDLMQTDEWKKANVENNTKHFADGVIGKLYGIWFIEVDNGVVFPAAGAASIDVHGTVFLGRSAYGIADINGSGKPEIIVHTAGSGGTADPLNQFNSVAWKCAFVAVRLQELAILRLETAATV